MDWRSLPETGQFTTVFLFWSLQFTDSYYCSALRCLVDNINNFLLIVVTSSAWFYRKTKLRMHISTTRVNSRDRWNGTRPPRISFVILWIQLSRWRTRTYTQVCKSVDKHHNYCTSTYWLLTHQFIYLLQWCSPLNPSDTDGRNFKATEQIRTNPHTTSR